MKRWLRQRIDTVYERLLSHELTGAPTHIAVIQDGNRRYARQNGDEAHEGHRAGAKTTERVLEWCQEIGVEELTLYTFSTENFDRPDEQKEALFDLLCDKLHEFADADRVHDNGVCIRAIGEIEMLPDRVQDAVDYAEEQTAGIDARVVDAEGEEVDAGKAGYVTVDKPWPGMLRTLYNNDERFLSEYWQEYSDPDSDEWVYFPEDGAKIDDDGYITILGRVDDVINVSADSKNVTSYPAASNVSR